MKRKRFLLLSAMLILVTFSCIDDGIENSTQEESVITKSLSEEELINLYRDIDGGKLPEVVITASYPRVAVQFASSGSSAGGGSYDFWGSYGGGSSTESWWQYSGGGGGGSSGNNSQIFFSENLIRRFPAGSNLSPNQMSKLNGIYRILAGVECVYRVMDDYISQNGKNIGKLIARPEQINFGDCAAVDENWNLIFYGNGITLDNIKHEWIHMYQRTSNSSLDNLSPEVAGMMEFELCIIQDIIFFVQYGKERFFNRTNTETYTSSWVSSVTGTPIADIQTDYIKWLSKICKGDKLTEAISDEDFLYWTKKYGQFNIVAQKFPQYNYQNKSYGTYISTELFNLIRYKECLK